VYERFSENARRAIALANREARHLQHDFIAPEHLLLGLLGLESGPAVDALRAFRVEAHVARKWLAELIPPGEGEFAPSRMPLTDAAEGAVRGAIGLADQAESGEVNSAYLLLALLTGETGVARLLTAVGVEPDELRANLERRVAGDTA
jgi:ATP-dependent Clp protease ATP-binding subunit ClpC